MSRTLYTPQVEDFAANVGKTVPINDAGQGKA
jgi:hypothetical protein